MAAIDDANTALTNLQTAAQAIVTKLGEAVAGAGVPEADVANLATGIQAVADQLNAAVNPPA